MKDKSDVLGRLMKKFNDPEFQEKMKQRREDYKKSLTSEYQLGFFVGEDIINRFLPTLSVEENMGKSIQISEEDVIEYKRLDNEWYNKYQHGKHEADEEWKAYQDFRQVMKTKYLPNPLICHEKLINIQNMDEFKNGLITSLWDSDSCNYSLKPEDIEIYDEEDYFTIIKFKLSENSGSKE